MWCTPKKLKIHSLQRADLLWSSCRLNVFFTGKLRNHYYTKVHCAVLSVWGSLLHREFSKWKECIISKINSVWIAQVRSSRPKFLQAVRPWCSKTNALSKFLLILPLHVICSLSPPPSLFFDILCFKIQFCHKLQEWQEKPLQAKKNPQTSLFSCLIGFHVCSS